MQSVTNNPVMSGPPSLITTGSVDPRWSDANAAELPREKENTRAKCEPKVVIDLSAQIDQALRATGHASLRHLQVRGTEGLAILHGCVPSYFMKQMAQEIALRILGVKEVQNELQVVPSIRHGAG
jgi:osmotically-inducible protein OsmY